MGYNLHPSIPTSTSELKVADIGTGTGFVAPLPNDTTPYIESIPRTDDSTRAQGSGCLRLLELYHLLPN